MIIKEDIKQYKIIRCMLSQVSGKMGREVVWEIIKWQVHNFKHRKYKIYNRKSWREDLGYLFCQPATILWNSLKWLV